MWMLFALLSAVLATLTSILAKVGIDGVNSNLATGVSWLCYYKALQIGKTSKVVPIDKMSVVITSVLAFIFLHEKFTVKSLIGCSLIGIGTIVMVL
ncbi:MAG: EamA family transporter [Roseburia sp.]|nr:EamA family transporter [Roseburia sp.]